MFAPAGHAIKGGGHAMAAGLTVSRERLADMRAYLESALAAPVDRGSIFRNNQTTRWFVSK